MKTERDIRKGICGVSVGNRISVEIRIEQAESEGYFLLKR